MQEIPEEKTRTISHTSFFEFLHWFPSKTSLHSKDLTGKRIRARRWSVQRYSIWRATSNVLYFCFILVRDQFVYVPSWKAEDRRPSRRKATPDGEGSWWKGSWSSRASQRAGTQTPPDTGNQYFSRRRAPDWHRISNEQKASSCLKNTPGALYQNSPHLIQASAEGISPSTPPTSFFNIYCSRSVVYTIYRTCQG